MLQSEFYLYGIETPLAVVAFQGGESLSASFCLQLTVRGPASLPTFERPVSAALLPDGDAGGTVMHGLVANATPIDTDTCLVFLQSPLELLDANSPELLFDGMDAPQAIAGLLAGGGLDSGKDFQLHLTESYAPWPELRSEGESPFDFLFNILAREGIACVHATMFQEDLQGQGGILLFSDDPARIAESIDLHIVRDAQVGRVMLPAAIRVCGGLGGASGPFFQGERLVPSGVRGTLDIDGQRIRSQEDAGHLARIIAERVCCTGWKIQGRTDQVLRPGMRVRDVNGHFGRKNDQYLITAVAHSAGLPDCQEYCCAFRAIPASVRFRPPRHISRKNIRAYVAAKSRVQQTYAAVEQQRELVKIEEKLLDISRMQAEIAGRSLEMAARTLTSDLDCFIWEVQNGIILLQTRENGLQEADRLQSELAWTRQRYCEERISFERDLENWGEDEQNIVL